MGFQLNPIFISNQESISNEELLNKLHIPNLKKGKKVNFFDTNKKILSVFVGDIGDYKLICSGELLWKAFENDNTFSDFKNSEVTALIWNETISSYGFCIVEKGMVCRKILVTDNEIQYNTGLPIHEELRLNGKRFFDPEEKEEIVDMYGKDEFAKYYQSELICRATDELSKKYLGVSLLAFDESIEFFHYVEE